MHVHGYRRQVLKALPPRAAWGFRPKRQTRFFPTHRFSDAKASRADLNHATGADSDTTPSQQRLRFALPCFPVYRLAISANFARASSGIGTGFCTPRWTNTWTK